MTKTATGPSEPERKPRGKLINLRVSDEEHAAFIAKAKASGRPLSALVRDLLEENAVRHREDERRLIFEINKIGVNLNQIARAINAVKGELETAQVLLYLDAITTYLDRLIRQDNADALA